jgi:hypothetical protein
MVTWFVQIHRVCVNEKFIDVWFREYQAMEGNNPFEWKDFFRGVQLVVKVSNGDLLRLPYDSQHHPEKIEPTPRPIGSRYCWFFRSSRNWFRGLRG